MGLLCGLCESARNTPDIFSNDEITNQDLRATY